MAKIKLKGNEIHTDGDIPSVGTAAYDFSLTNTDLKDIKLSEYIGKKIILNIFPSVDTPVCAASVRRFNEEANKLKNSVVFCISADLPFAHKRFCGAEGLESVISLSVFRNSEFGDLYGLKITDGPLRGLLARSVIIIDETGRIIYIELVPEIGQEPDYIKAISFLK